MITMLDVAKKAGVSKATVSRVLNGKNIVSEEVKSLVYKAIEETGYRPNLLARQLSMQKSNMIGLVMTNALYGGQYFSSLIFHAASFSEENQYRLVLADGKHSADDERNAIQFLLDMKCAGIIVYPKHLNVEALDDIVENSTTPIVVINRQLDRCVEQSVFMDHYESAGLLMDYILQQGHKEIAFISGMVGSYSSHYRQSAYQDRLKKHNIALDPQRIVGGEWSLESGYLAVRELLSREIHFTAILAGNDDMAIGAMKALKDAGYRIPEDISIASFDNIAVGNYVTPALTTVNIPMDLMVKTAILQIIGLSCGAEREVITGELIVRNSVQRI